MAKFAEFPFRNCLEIRDRSRMGAPRAAKRGGRSPNSGASCHQRGALRRFRLFSKQFQKGNSAKFEGWDSLRGLGLLVFAPHQVGVGTLPTETLERAHTGEQAWTHQAA